MQTSATDLPSINVLDSFFGGGAQTGATTNHQNRIELQNFTSWQVGNHFLKFGVRLRRVAIDSISPANFGGSYTFAGGPGPRLDANNQIVLGPNGQPEQIELSSLERYRRTLIFERLGMGPAQIRSLGGGATQFFIAGGDSEATVHQTDISLFVQDEWKLKPNLTLSPGLRYENQTNIKSPLNIAPRIAFAWSPVFAKSKSTGQASKTKNGDAPKDPQKAPQTSAAGGSSSTVIRGGVGVFYYRISEDLSLQAQRFNGLKQQQYLVTDNSILDLFPNVPAISLLSSFSLPQTRRFIASDLTPGTSLRASLSIARQLNRDLRVTVGYTHTNISHTLRTVNINAPLPGTHNPDARGNDIRPFGQAAGNILEAESNGRSVSNSLNINVNGKYRKLNFWTSYTLAKSSSTDGGTSGSSQNPYDFSQEWGRSSYDFRHYFYANANCQAPFGLSFYMFLMGNSGAPFNVTIGRDVNGDTNFSERPAFATDLNKPGVIQTSLGALDPNPDVGQRIIPRNLGQGPWFLSIGMGAGKEFKFGRAIPPGSVEGKGVVNVEKGASQPATPVKTPVVRPYSLGFSVYAINLLNSANPGTPVGNMASPYFLNSTGISGQFFGNGGTGGNRQITLSVRLGF